MLHRSHQQYASFTPPTLILAVIFRSYLGPRCPFWHGTGLADDTCTVLPPSDRLPLVLVVPVAERYITGPESHIHGRAGVSSASADKGGGSLSPGHRTGYSNDELHEGVGESVVPRTYWYGGLEASDSVRRGTVTPSPTLPPLLCRPLTGFNFATGLNFGLSAPTLRVWTGLIRRGAPRRTGPPYAGSSSSFTSVLDSICRGLATFRFGLFFFFGMSKQTR